MSNQNADMTRKRPEPAPTYSLAAAPESPSAPGFHPQASDLGHSELVHDSWREFLRSLPLGARVLDIAPGIGAVSLLAQEISNERRGGFEVHSLDESATWNSEPLLMNGIRFHARRYDKRMVFDDAYFDAISMQWAPPDDSGTAESALTELRRILKQNGRIRMLFHAQGGLTHEQCLGRMRAVDTILDEFRLLQHARHMFEVAFTQETALRRDPVQAAALALESQQRYTQAAAGIAGWMSGTPNPKAAAQVLQLVDNCWERRQELTYTAVMAHLDRVEQELRSAQTRMRIVAALAVDETRAHRIARLFKAVGFRNVKIRALRVPLDEALLGWDLLAC